MLAICSGQKLSAKESAELQYKREVLRLAKRRKADLEELEADDGYHMPDTYDGDKPRQSDRYKLLTERYKCVPLPAGCIDRFQLPIAGKW